MVDRNRRRGTGFTNIGSYLQASGTSGLAGAVGQGIKGKAEEAEKEVEQVSSGFQQEAEQSRIGEKGGEEEQTVSGILGKFEDPNFGRETVGEEDIGTIGGFLNAEYKGPMDIQKEQKESLKAKEEALGRLAGHTRTAEGREALLKRFAGGKGYTRGQQKLDTMLLGKGGQSQLEEARREATGVTGRIRDISEGARLRGEQYQREAQQFAEGIKSRFGEVGSGIQESVKTAAEARLDALNRLAGVERDMTDEANRAQVEADLAALGLYDAETGEGYQYLYGAADPVVQARDAVTGEYRLGESDLAKVRTLEQGLKLEALNKLLGQTEAGGGYRTTTADETLDEAVQALEQSIERGKTSFEQESSQLMQEPIQQATSFYSQFNNPNRLWTMTGSGYNYGPAWDARNATIKFMNQAYGWGAILDRAYPVANDSRFNSLTLGQLENYKNQYQQNRLADIRQRYGVY